MSLGTPNGPTPDLAAADGTMESKDVTIDATSGNSVDLQHFLAGQIAGGWEPEPYESQYILKGNGKLVVDESSLWPNQEFPATELVVTTSLLTNHPDIVRDLVKGLIQSVDWINANPAAAQTAANADLTALTGAKALPANAPVHQHLREIGAMRLVLRLVEDHLHGAHDALRILRH